MKGFQLTFFTRQGQRHGHELVSDWLLGISKKAGAYGGTVVSGSEGFDHAGLYHSASFFELSDQPMAVTVSVDEEHCDALLEEIGQAGISISYTRIPIEYGTLNG